jgi:hypothetical protein
MSYSDRRYTGKYRMAIKEIERRCPTYRGFHINDMHKAIKQTLNLLLKGNLT